MKTTPVSAVDRNGVLAVPPLCRREDGTIDWAQSTRVVEHLVSGGIRRLMYGGNAFLYHITLAEYEELLAWLSALAGDLWLIPSVGPSYGRMIDQVAIVKRHKFPCVMALPCADPRDAAGIEVGLRRFVDQAGVPLIVYLKEENNFGADLNAGLDAVARLVRDGYCVGIKYAVVRQDPSVDAYLTGLLERVDRELVISGIGERPAITHLEKFGLIGFTSGSVCVAPARTQRLYELLRAGQNAESVRSEFLPLEDKRDAWGPARVLHAAVELAGIANTGPVPPFITGLNAAQREQLAPIATELYGRY